MLTLVVIMALGSGWIGLEADVPHEVEGQQQLACARVKYLEPDGPAYRAGVHPGDCIVAVSNITIRSTRDLVVAVEGSIAGQELTLTLDDGRQLKFNTEARSAGRERRFCEYLKKRRTIVTIMGGDEIPPTIIVLKAPMTLRAFMKEFHYARPTRIVHGEDCGTKQSRPTIAKPALDVVLRDGDQLDFYLLSSKGAEETGRTY